jgi:hypothetical protein
VKLPREGMSHRPRHSVAVFQGASNLSSPFQVVVTKRVRVVERRGTAAKLCHVRSGCPGGMRQSPSEAGGCKVWPTAAAQCTSPIFKLRRSSKNRNEPCEIRPCFGHKARLAKCFNRHKNCEWSNRLGLPSSASPRTGRIPHTAPIRRVLPPSRQIDALPNPIESSLSPAKVLREKIGLLEADLVMIGA